MPQLDKLDDALAAGVDVGDIWGLEAMRAFLHEQYPSDDDEQPPEAEQQTVEEPDEAEADDGQEEDEAEPTAAQNGTSGEQSKPSGKSVPPVLTFTAADLQNEDFGEIFWVVHGLIAEGLTLLVAPPKRGKSWLVLQLAMAITRQLAFLGLTVTPCEVLYLALEDGKRRLKDRLDSLTGGSEDPWPQGLHFHIRWPALGKGFEEAMEKWLTEHPQVKLVIIDTLEKVRGAGGGKETNVYRQDYRVVGTLKEIADRHHIAILVVHHTRKPSVKKDAGDVDPFDEVSGSNGIMGAADCGLRLKHPAKAPVAELVCRGRDIDERTIYMLWDPAQCMWNLSPAATQQQVVLSEERQAIWSYLVAQPHSKPKAIAEGTGKNYSTVKSMLRVMLHAGQITKEEGGVYSVVCSPPSPACSSNPCNPSS